jgi:hypothetical protein
LNISGLKQNKVAEENRSRKIRHKKTGSVVTGSRKRKICVLRKAGNMGLGLGC